MVQPVDKKDFEQFAGILPTKGKATKTGDEVYYRIDRRLKSSVDEDGWKTFKNSAEGGSRYT